MIEHVKIKTVIEPLLEWSSEQEDYVPTGQSRMLTVVWVDKFSTFAEAPNGEVGIVDDIYLICFDPKAEEKKFIRVSIDDVKIGKYEINEFRRGHSSHGNKARPDRNFVHPGISKENGNE